MIMSAGEVISAYVEGILTKDEARIQLLGLKANDTRRDSSKEENRLQSQGA